MKLSLLTPRDAETNIMFTFSFTVSFGPPTEISCRRNGIQFFPRADSLSVSPVVSREVIRSHYINSSYPDLYSHKQHHENQVHILVLCMLPVVLILVFLVLAIVLTELSKRAVEPQQPVSQVSAVHCSLLVLLFLPSVASPPTAVMVYRTGINSVLVSWSAPSSAPAGYEVFYQVAGGSTLSGGNTNNTELTLTGLTLGEHSFFVVGYGAEGEPVLPSAHSNTASVIIGEICHCE